MPSVFIKTYGCQMNERDSEAVAAQLLTRGYTIATSETSADVVLLNTCSVRDNAEQTALGKMSAMVGESRKHRPGQKFGFLGCMAQSRGRELINQLPGVDLVLGTQKFHKVAESLDDIIASKKAQIVDTGEEEGSESRIREHLLNPAGRPPVSAFVSIMQGCNQHCTFCIVPQTRGEERSRPIAEIVSECQELVARGTREITLLGQIVTSYAKRDLPVRDGKSPFVQLIEAVHQIDGLDRIRFTSPHPKGYGDDLVRAYVELPKLAAHAHLPVQSGSDRILKLMHRGYGRRRYMEIIQKLRTARPDIGITTDIIVGFPGETDDDFEQTLSLCREAVFDNAFLFKYSPRRDTPAAAMSGQLSEEVIEQRHAELLRQVNAIGETRYSTFIGRQVSILVEGQSKRNLTRMSGRTSCNKIVVFDGSERHRGHMMDLRITRCGSFTLYGDPAIVNL